MPCHAIPNRELLKMSQGLRGPEKCGFILRGLDPWGLEAE